jgi:phage shock protein C
MKLYRVTSEAVLGGVCAGLARYLNIPVAVVRLIFIILVFMPGIGVILYLALWFLLPPETRIRTEAGFTSQEWAARGQQFGQEVNELFTRRRENTLRLIGGGLVLLGLLAFVRVFAPDIFNWIDRLNGPILLIVLGAVLLVLAFKGKK